MAVGSTTTVYPSKYFSITSTTNGATTTATSTSYIFAGDTLVSYIEQALINGTATGTPSMFYVHPDHLGSTNVVTNASGTVVQVLDYYPYGSQRISSGSQVSDRQFIGERYDASTDLNYLNARYLQSTRGQFLSQDPVFWEIGSKIRGRDQEVFLRNPQSLNSYSYAENNPIIKKDPEGRCGLLLPLCLAAIGANLGIWTNYAGSVLEKQAQGSQNPYEFDMSYRELGTSGTLGAFELAALPAKRIGGGVYAFGSSLAEDNAAGQPLNFNKAAVSGGTAFVAGSFFKNLVGNVPASLATQSQITNSVFQHSSILVANNSLGTNSSSWQNAQSAAKAVGVGNTGSGTFVGTYNFGPGIGTFNFGTGSWATSQSTPSTK